MDGIIIDLDFNIYLNPERWHSFIHPFRVRVLKICRSIIISALRDLKKRITHLRQQPINQ
jgi:hypothetical protein